MINSDWKLFKYPKTAIERKSWVNYDTANLSQDGGKLLMAWENAQNAM